MISNTTAIAEVMGRMDTKFDLMYAKRGTTNYTLKFEYLCIVDIYSTLIFVHKYDTNYFQFKIMFFTFEV